MHGASGAARRPLRAALLLSQNRGAACCVSHEPRVWTSPDGPFLRLRLRLLPADVQLSSVSLGDVRTQVLATL